MSSTLVHEVLKPGGLLARRYPGYEPRPSQVEMSEAVANAISAPHHLLVEAPPGTGKTFAYLVPAIASGRTVVISTGTRTLQDQLFHRDIPLLAKVLGRPIRAALMKGRENYLCLHRLDEISSQKNLSGLTPELQEETERIEAVRAWSKETETGDKSELDGFPEPWYSWEKIDARADTCLGQKCALFDPCFLTKMRRNAQEADLIVVNHHLLLSDLVLKASAYGAVIPPYRLLVVDEAHMLEDVATSHLGRTLSSYMILDLLADAATASEHQEMFSEVESRALKARCREVRGAVTAFVEQNPTGSGRFLLAARRLDQPWLESGEDLAAELNLLAGFFEELDHPSDISEALRRRALGHASTLNFLLKENDESQVMWGERRGRGTFLTASPIEVGEGLQALLFDVQDSVTLTSSTLTVNGSFEFVQSRVGPRGAASLTLQSPFDLSEQSVLYIPKKFPEPSNPDFGDALVEEVLSLIDITEGHAFILFTSIASMRRTRDALEGRLDYPLLMQGEASRRAILEKFRATPNAVLLATSSFWQGVDVPGDALRLVVIEKLPFNVPSDPIVAARCDAIKRRGENPFEDYQIPSAVIDLKQGLGRLIRTRTDRGVLAILDSRLRTRRYGEIFLKSLPPYPLIDDIEAARSFFLNVGEIAS